jgi:hypothetical protein
VENGFKPGGLAIMAFFLKSVWHFEDIFREFEAFLKISILLEDIFREIQAFLN